jgi:hypothetical protein
MIISTDCLLWNLKDLRGGYSVHPVPAPPSIKEENIINNKAGTITQNLILLSRGKDKSGEKIFKGKNQLP